MMSRIANMVSGRRTCSVGNIEEGHQDDIVDIINDIPEPEQAQGLNYGPSLRKRYFREHPQEALNEALGEMDFDPTTGFNCPENITFEGDDDTIKAAFKRARENPQPGKEFLQPNSLANTVLTPGSELLIMAPTQGGKTKASWFLDYIVAVRWSLLPVFFAMNKESEPVRFSKEAEAFNDFITLAMKILDIGGLTDKVFWFTSVHTEDTCKNAIWTKEGLRVKNYMAATVRWVKTKSIPFVVTISNKTRFGNMKAVFDVICSNNTIYPGNKGFRIKPDGQICIPMMANCDEVDTLLTNEDYKKCAFYSEEVKIDTVDGEFSADSLYELGECLVDITATPMTLAVTKRKKCREIVPPVELEPSICFFGYMMYAYQRYNLIARERCSNYYTMIGHMMDTLLTESALVYTAGNAEQRSRCIDAAGTFKKILSMAWESKTILVATCNAAYISLFDDLDVINRTIEEMFGLETDSVTKVQFKRKIKSNGVVTFEWKGLIDSYPLFMQLLASIVNMDDVHKTVLFAGAMASRGTPIKASKCHLFGLTYMFVKDYANAEHLIQLLGRLCGIVAQRDMVVTKMVTEGGVRVQKRINHVKTLWAPKEVHDFHELALKKMPVFRHLITNNVDFKVALDVTQALVEGARSGDRVEDIYGVLSALLIGGKDGRKCITGSIDRKRKAIEGSPADVVRNREFGSVFSTGVTHGVSHTNTNSVHEGVADCDDGLKEFVKNKQSSFKRMVKYVKENRGTSEDVFVHIDTVATPPFIKFLEDASKNIDMQRICREGQSPDGGRIRTGFMEVKISAATGTRNRSTMVRLTGKTGPLASAFGKFLSSVFIPRGVPSFGKTIKCELVISFIIKYLQNNGGSATRDEIGKALMSRGTDSNGDVLFKSSNTLAGYFHHLQRGGDDSHLSKNKIKYGSGRGLVYTLIM